MTTTTKTETFRVSTRDAQGEIDWTRPLFTIEAADYTEAARLAGRKLNPGIRKLSVLRTTGDHGKSGWFQGYRPTGNGDTSISSCGPAFHVM